MESPKSPWKKELLRRQNRSDLTVIAARALKEQNISLVECGDQVQYRCGHPLVLIRVEWGVPGAQLSLASKILSEQGFPCVAPTPTLIEQYGEWDTTGVIHNQDDRGWSQIHLYPLSFLGFSLDDTVEVTSTFQSGLKLLSPKPPMYMLSLLRYLSTHPPNDRGRARVERDLVQFISCYIFRDPPSMNEDGDNESEEDFQKRMEEAVLYMRSWDWGDTPQEYLDIAEQVTRDCQSIEWLSGSGLPS